MQNQSLIVHGTIRALKECSEVPNNSCVRAIQAEVIDSVLNAAVHWELDSRGCGKGRHFAEKHQDPTLVNPICRADFTEQLWWKAMTESGM